MMHNWWSKESPAHNKSFLRLLQLSLKAFHVSVNHFRHAQCTDGLWWVCSTTRWEPFKSTSPS